MMKLTILLMFSLFASPLVQQRPDDGRGRQEERDSYFKKWLDEDVKYIITDEEKNVFRNLTTDEEREAFVEQFWFRRDTDPRTAENEFKAEHYRRIAFANENFQSGKPGWMTDRGRVYIIQGEPASIERHPAGGPYARKRSEGGASTFTYPFEVWYYHYVEGLGEDIELEFVDPSMSGEYRLALRPEEKDMLLYVSGTAPTIDELTGRASGRVDRAFFNPGLENNVAWQNKHGYTARDTPFARYNKFTLIQKAPEIKFSDLKQIIETNITYQDFPFQVRSDFVQLDDQQVLIPVTIQVPNSELTFETRGGRSLAKANIYGVVRNMVGRVEAEFEDSVVAEYRSDYLEHGRQILSVYQKLLALDAGRKYRIDLVVRDEKSSRVGVLQQALVAPSFDAKDKLETSSMILTRFVEPALDPKIDERFVIGNLKIIPNVTSEFKPGEELQAYLQVYHVELDQSSIRPDLKVTYRLRKDSEVVREILDNSAESVQYFSPQRIVLLEKFDLSGLSEGTYQLEVSVEDRIGQRKAISTETFRVIAGS